MNISNNTELEEANNERFASLFIYYFDYFMKYGTIVTIPFYIALLIWYKYIFQILFTHYSFYNKLQYLLQSEGSQLIIFHFEPESRLD